MSGIFSLMYHDVRPWNPNYFPKRYKQKPYLTVKEFKKHLDYLQKNFEIISPEEINFENIYHNEKKKLILTFDDGLKDHILEVLPILLSKGVPAIFFVPAESIQKGIVFHSHKIQFLLAKIPEKELVEEIFKILPLCYEKFRLNPLSRDEVWKKYSFDNVVGGTWSKEAIFTTRLLREHKFYSFRDCILSKLFQEIVSSNEEEFAENLYLNLEDIRKLILSNMNIGGHGFHSINAKFELPDIQEIEVNKSFDFLSQKIFNKEKFNFYYSYPNGGYTTYTQQLLKKLNCRGAFTTNRKIFSNESHLEIPRLDGPHDFRLLLENLF